jgi:hypothetical protein
MHKTTTLPLLAAGLLLAATVHAQDATTVPAPVTEPATTTVPAPAPADTACPQLPANAGLTWEYHATGDSDLCRALRADGSEAFGLYISPKPNFEPERSNREESGRIDGQEIDWYSAELAAQPGVKARETVLALPDGRSAHIWVQAPNTEVLAAAIQQAQSIHFTSAAEQVAGP